MSSKRREIGELVLGLLAEVAAVHQEQDAFGAGELEQAIGDVDGREGFAGAGGHLDEGAEVGVGKGILEVADGGALDFPKSGVVEGRQALEARAQLVGLREPFGEGFGAEETEDLATAGLRVEAVGEVM